MTVLGGTVTVRATYKDKEIPGVPKYDLYVINGQGSGQYAYNRKVDITADPAPAGKTFDKWVVVDETVTVENINNSKTTLKTISLVEHISVRDTMSEHPGMSGAR